MPDPSAPLFNRAADGLYPAGAALGPLLLAAAREQATIPTLPARATYTLDGRSLACAFPPEETTWSSTILNGCPAPAAVLVDALGPVELLALADGLGLFTAPALRLSTQTGARPETLAEPIHWLLSPESTAEGDRLMVSPLQMALAAAVLSNQGRRTDPVLVSAVNTPQSGWVMLHALTEQEEVFSSQTAQAVVDQLADSALPIWQATACIPDGASGVCWYIGGTLESWAGAPFALALLLENPDPELVTAFGRGVLESAITP